MRVLIANDPFKPSFPNTNLFDRGVWLCSWIQCADVGEPPYVAVYRRRIFLECSTTIRVHISADEHYELFIDGERVGQGPERGDPNNWFYETYDLAFNKGQHLIVAKVATLGFAAPRSQLSVCPGFILAPQERDYIRLLGTGVAEWEAKPISGYRFEKPFGHDFFSMGYNTVLDGNLYPWGVERGEGEGWKPALKLHAGADADLRNRYPAIHLMRPAILPPMHEKDSSIGVGKFVSTIDELDPCSTALNPRENLDDELTRWNSFIGEGGQLSVPARTSRRIIFDLENYFCAYPQIRISGGKGASLR
jgi:hypothetical protein